MSDTTPIEHPSWLTTGDFTAADEPLRLFAAWLTDATASEPRDPTAMTLATVDANGLPNARMVLLKGTDERGFVFYTNMDSQKGQELGAHPQAALVFYWKSSNRQVRVRGSVERVTDAEADAYFATRSRDSQLGAWASYQSRPLDARSTFEKRYEDMRRRFDGQDVPRPARWGGFRVKQELIEFWDDRPHRLHERRVFTAAVDGWKEGLLYP